jgi:hypothetical protein
MTPGEIQNLITGSAALGGAVIGGGFSWLASWAGQFPDYQDEVMPQIEAVDRAYVAVLLVGPESVRLAAEAVRKTAWAIYETSWELRPGAGTVSGRQADYTIACKKFAETACTALGN